MLLLPAPNVRAKSDKCNAPPPPQEQQQPGAACLSCFVELLQNGAPLPSADAVRRSAISIMEALVYSCPACIDGEEALLSWTRDWLTFGCGAGSCSTPAFSGEVCSLRPRAMGSALADVLVALYTYVVRHGGPLSGGASVAMTEGTCARTTPGTAAASLRCRGRDSEDTHWVVLVDLVQFLFSCWEMLLAGIPVPSSQRPTSSHVSTAFLNSHEASLQCRQAVFDCSEAASQPSPMLLGETDDGVPEENERQRCFCEGRDEETLQLTESHENVAQVTVEHVQDVVRRVISEVFRVADDDAAAIEAGHSTGLLRTPAAAAMFLKFVHISPLLRRLICSSPLLIRSLARYLLPRLVSLHHRQQQYHCQTAGERKGRGREATTAVEAILSALYIVSSSAALSIPMWSAQPLSVIASQLSCRCGSWESEMPTASKLADSDGATLLQSLCAALQSGGGAHSLPLRLQALRLLCLLSSSPTTRRGLFFVCRRGDAATASLTREERRGSAYAIATATVASSLPKSSAPDVATHLLPLLLSGEDEEESVQLICSVLQMILLHVQSASPSAPFPDMCGSTAQAASAAAAAATASFTEDDPVGTADDVSGIEVAVHLANHIKDYVIQALYSCTCKSGYALVELLNRAASIVTGARTLLHSASIEENPSVELDGAVERWERQQDWRVVFHVAEVDIALFEVLLKGTALHNALVQCSVTGVSDDGSETRLCWDEVASNIAAVAAHERGGQLSLFCFLRCLDALATGMQGNMRALWSSRLRQLVHELFERVGVNLQGATWRPVDTAAAMRAFSALVTSGVLHGNCNDRPLIATDAPHVRDLADKLLLRRMVDPQTLHLLTRVTAAYLPASSDLVPLGVQLLLDLAHTGELIAVSCPASSDYPTMVSASVEESRCLLRIATLLMRMQLESWVTPVQTHQAEERRAGCASGGAGPTDEKLPTLTYSGSARLYMPPRSSGSARYDDDRVGLLDVLLGLYPEAPELLIARTEFIDALARRHGAADAQPHLLAAHASTFIGAASLTEVTMRASDIQASLLLSTATLGCPPCVGRQELCTMLADRYRVLCRRLEQTASRNSNSVPAALWSTEATVEESDAVGPAITETASDIEDDDAGRLLDALQEVFTLLVVRMLWYGVADSDPTLPWPTPSSQVPADHAAGDRSFSEVHAQTLMACVEGSEEFRVSLCQYLFDLHTQYRVDVRGFLTLLQGEDNHVPRPRQLQQVQAPLHVLFAAAVLSVVLYVVDESGQSTAIAGAASPLLTYMRSLRSVHWLANTPLRQANIPLSVELLLKSVFRVAKRELLSLNHSHHHQEQRADVAPDPITASLPGIGSLQFVYGELTFQQHRLRSGTPPAQRTVAELVARDDVLHPTPSSAPGAALAIFLLREHLVPLLLRTNSNTAAHRNGLSMSVAALEYSTVLLRLMSAALWPLAPATCTSLDAVLAEYAMSHAHRLLALTTAELVRADSATRKLLFPLLQLLYLLLTRAHKVDVVRRYSTDLLLFAFRARHAAIARSDLITFGEVKQDALTDCDEDFTHVCVIASIVYITARQIADPQRKVATGGTGVGSATCVAPATSDGTAAAGGGGLVPPPLEGIPWYAWVPVFHYYRRLQTAVGRTTNNNRAAGEQRQSMLRIVVSGAEYVCRLCGVSDLACCSYSAAPVWPIETVQQIMRGGRNPSEVSEGPAREEHQATTILIDWCAELIFTSRMNGDDFDGAGLNVVVVAARLLYLLFYRFRALAASSVWLNALVLSFMRQTAPSRRLQLPVVAEGWLLAALMRALPNVQHWCAYDDHVKGRTIRYFEKPEIAARVQPLPHPPPKESPAHATAEARTTVPEEAVTAGATRRAYPFGGWADVSVVEPELSCVLRILVSACRQYERSPHRLCRRRRLEVIVPLGLQLLDESSFSRSSVSEYAFPYSVPLASAGAPPLLLVFRCLTDRIRE